MLMTSLFPIPTQTVIRWLRPFLLSRKILKSRQMSEVLPFLLQSPPSLYSPLNLCNLTPIFESLWITPYCPWKGTPMTPGSKVILGMTFDPHIKFNAHVKSLVTRALPRINILKALIGINWGQQEEDILINYKSLIMYPFHAYWSQLVPQHLTIPYPETPNYPKLCLPDSHCLC